MKFIYNSKNADKKHKDDGFFWGGFSVEAAVGVRRYFYLLQV